MSCASPTTPSPPLGPHTAADNGVFVSSMPETVLVEAVPPSPGEGAVWVDGGWTWVGRRWVWTPGSWQVPPEGAYYARPSLIRLGAPLEQGPDGGSSPSEYGMRLVFVQGHWHLADGGTWQLGEDGGVEAGK